MVRRRPVLALAVALLAVITVAGSALVFDLASTPGPPPTPDPDATLVEFVATGGTCVDRPARDVSVEQRSADGGTLVTVAGNVTVPGAAYALDEPTLGRSGPANYTLDVTSHATEKPERRCRAVARYTATVRVPQPPDERFRVVVRHDGELATVVWNAPRESGAGAAVSVPENAS